MAESEELVKTRLSPPIEVGALLPRERLLALGAELSGHKLSVLQAPAGYGKTSLMSQWRELLREQGRPAGWLSVDSTGLSPIDLLAYIAAAVTQELPELADQVEPIINSRRHQTPDGIITTLVNCLVNAGSPVHVFIDDLHFLSADAIVQLKRFIELAPREFGLVVASRSQVDLGLATARARGQAFEIGIEQLRFTAGEIRDFMEATGLSSIGESSLALLGERTDGWVTGIKLVSLALRDSSDGNALIQEYSGSQQDVSDYFAEQVLSRQDHEVQDFLLRSSLLEKFCAPMCDAVLQLQHSGETLRRVASAGLFLVGLDQERNWYRYHPLFRDFLNRRLRDSGFDDEAAVLLRASEWYREQGSLVDSIAHAFAAGNPDRAAELLESCCQDWTYRGRISLVTQFVEEIPRQVLLRYPTIMLTWAWHLIRHLQFEEAGELLDTVRAYVEHPERYDFLDPGGLVELRHQLLHREMTLAAANDNAALTEQKSEQLLAGRDQLHPYLTGSVYAQTLYAARVQFRLKEVDSLAASARGVLERSGYDFALLAVLSEIGSAFSAVGKIDSAIQALQEGIDVAIRYGGKNSPLIALPGLPLSAILYERNDIKTAEELLARQLANATDWGMVDQFVAAYVTQFRILLLHEQFDEALQCLEEGMALALDRRLERLRISLVGEHLRFLTTLQSGTRAQVIKYAKGADIPASSDAVAATANSQLADALLAHAWYRVAMASDEVAEAVHLAKGWRRFSESRGAQLVAVRWGILLAEAQLLAGDVRTAQRTMREAIATAAPLGAVRSFVDEGAAVRTLVEQCCQAQLNSTHPTDLYAAKLLTAFGGKLKIADAGSEERVYGSLTDREIEVLLLVSAGMRNREVAERLGMTEGSIKWYMQQIFDKLDTRSRLQAVSRARNLGFIA